MTKAELIDKAKIIFVRVHKDAANKLNPLYYTESHKLLDEKTYLSIGSELESNHYPENLEIGHNYHHYTTKFWRSQLPKIADYLNIEYNENDFKIVENTVKGYDFSYLLPSEDIQYKVSASEFKFDGKYVVYYPYALVDEGTLDKVINTDVANPEYLFVGSDHMVNSPYHRLYKYMHQCSVIEKLTHKSGRSICISCDSFIIPIIPFFARYFDKVVLLDNRLMNTHMTFLYDDNFTDSLIFGSYCSQGLEKLFNINY